MYQRVVVLLKAWVQGFCFLFCFFFVFFFGGGGEGGEGLRFQTRITLNGALLCTIQSSSMLGFGITTLTYWHQD